MLDMPVEPSGEPHYSSDMESRLAVLEEIAAATKVALIDFRAEMREMRHEFRNEIGGLRTEMHAEIGGLRSELRSDYRWLMGLMLAAAAGILAVMAHGFHWF